MTGEPDGASARPGRAVPQQPGEPAEHRAERLKERVYITFTALAVVLALSAHAGDVLPGQAAFTLLITVVGAVTAVFTASVVAHIAAHGVLPSREQTRRMFRASFGALAVLVLPMIFLGLAALGRWTISGALTASVVALIVSLVAIGLLALRRVRLEWWKRLLVLLLEAALGVAVVGLELLAHSL